MQTSSKERIRSLLSSQAKAWNNCDLDEFMRGYLNSEETTYTSGGNVVRGYDALKKRYQDRYGTAKETMGELTFSNLDIDILDEKSAVCLGEWHLERKSAEALDGVFTLVLVHREDGWKIIHDHTSSKSPEKPKSETESESKTETETETETKSAPQQHSDSE